MRFAEIIDTARTIAEAEDDFEVAALLQDDEAKGKEAFDKATPQVLRRYRDTIDRAAFAGRLKQIAGM